MKKIGCVNHDCERCRAQTTAMKLALEACKAFIAYDSGDTNNDVGMMIAYFAAVEINKEAIAALEKELACSPN